MTTYSADAVLTFPSHTAYASLPINSRISDGRPRRKRAFGYVRVSTDMQAQYGLSLDAQKDQIAAYARACTAIGCAKYWKAQRKSLREIADKLMENGHRPKRGGQWYAQQVKMLLIS